MGVKMGEFGGEKLWLEWNNTAPAGLSGYPYECKCTRPLEGNIENLSPRRVYGIFPQR